MYQKIVAEQRPLLLARAALDQAYDHTKHEMRTQFASGEPLRELVNTLPDEPLEAQARTLLDLPLTERDTMSNWFSLQATMASRKNRIFATMAFKSVEYADIRSNLADDSYVAFGGILRRALEMNEETHLDNDDKRLRLAGAINRLSVYAALNFFETSALMESSPVITQRTAKIDGRFHYYADEFHRHTPLMITASEQSVLPGMPSKNTVLIHTKDFFADYSDQYRMAHLIVKDLSGEATDSEFEEMNDRAWELRWYITDMDDSKVAELQEAKELRRPQRAVPGND